MNSVHFSDYNFFLKLPKFELHLHVEGALDRDYMFELQRRFRPDLQRAEYEAEFNYSCFRDFLTHWWKQQQLLFGPKGLGLGCIAGLAEAFSDYLNRLNVVYAEAHISPIDSCCVRYAKDFRHHPESWRDFLLAWTAAFAEINQQKNRPLVRLIVDLVRNHGPETAHWQLDIFKDLAQDLPEICGFGLGGGMSRFQIAEFRSVADRIREMGLPFFIHAGEYEPAAVAEAEVCAAIDIGAVRIGHGIHINQSEKVMERVKNSGVILEVCPGSNVCTATVSSLALHPLPVLYKAGIPIVIGSDDPCFFGNNICQEYESLVKFMHFSNSELEQLLINSVKYSFAPEALKEKTLKYYRKVL